MRDGEETLTTRVSKRLRGGFTLIELMIVLVVLAIIVAIAVPNLLSARLNANETASIARLRTVSSAQAQFARSGKADEDNDAQGEYGFFAELGGRVGVRGGTSKVPTDLPASMGIVDANGEVVRAGYVFRIYLPAATGVGTRESAGGGIATGVIDPDLGEGAWCCYAWPVGHGKTGSRTFFINQQSEITQTFDVTHTGVNAATIQAGSAFMTGDLTKMTGSPAVGTVAADGNIWRVVQ